MIYLVSALFSVLAILLATIRLTQENAAWHHVMNNNWITRLAIVAIIASIKLIILITLKVNRKETNDQ